MHIVLILKVFSLVAVTHAGESERSELNYINDLGPIQYRAKEHTTKTVGRWENESLFSGMPRVMDKGNL